MPEHAYQPLPLPLCALTAIRTMATNSWYVQGCCFLKQMYIYILFSVLTNTEFSRFCSPIPDSTMVAPWGNHLNYISKLQ